MRLLRLRAYFGVLNGIDLPFSPTGMNLVVDENERGKSTLVAAIACALYGLDAKGRGSNAERERYRPLTGDRFEVELDLESAGRRLRVRRNLARNSCNVEEIDSVHNVTAEFASGKNGWDLGTPLLGLGREQFLRSALVRQGDVCGVGAGSDAATLTSRIQQLVDSNAGDNTAANAIRALDEALRGYHGTTLKDAGHVTNEIGRLQKGIVASEAELTELRRRRTALDGEAETLARAQAELGTLRRDRDRAARLAGEGDVQFARMRLEQDRQRRERRAALSTQHAALAHVEDVEPGLHAALATLDGSIAARQRQLALEAEALDAASRARGAAEARLDGCDRLRGASRESVLETGRCHERLRTAIDDEVATAAALHRAAGRPERRGDGQAGAPRRPPYTVAAAGTLPAPAVLRALNDEDMQDPRNSAQPAEQWHASPFAALGREDAEDLARYGERRSDLLVRIAALPPERQGTGGGWMPVLMGGGMLAVLGLLLVFTIPVAGMAFALTGAALAGWALVRRSGVTVAPRSPARLQLERDLQSLDGHTAAIAQRLGYPDPIAANSALRRWQEQRLQHEEAIAAERQHVGATARLKLAYDAATRLLQRWGRLAAVDTAEPGLLLALQDELTGYLDGTDRLTRARDAEAAARQRVEQTRQAQQLEIDAFADRAGVPARNTTARTETMRRLGEQLNLLEQRRLLVSQLQEVGSGLLDENERAQLAAVATATYAVEPRHPAGEPVCSPAEHRLAMQQLTIAADEAAQTVRRLESGIATALDDFERRYPQIEERLTGLRTALNRARRFAEAAGLARAVLAEVASETHRDWSGRLNQAAGAVLDRAGSAHTEIRFSEQLDFVVRDRQHGHEWSRLDIERRFSAGARDQVYLAIRLALAGYFSDPADPLPLILDDPLVTSDDRRFAAVMAYLAAAAQQRQIIVLTCHEGRHRRWLAETSDAAVTVLSLQQPAGKQRYPYGGEEPAAESESSAAT